MVVLPHEATADGVRGSGSRQLPATDQKKNDGKKINIASDGDFSPPREASVTNEKLVMNNPNPSAPEGALNDSASKPKSNVRLFVFVIIAIHAVFFAGVLLQACKPKDDKPTGSGVPTPPPLDYTPAGNTGLPPGGPAFNPPGGPGNFAATPPLPPGPVAPAFPEPPPAQPPVQPPVLVPPTIKSEVPPSVDGPKQHVIGKGDSFSTLAKKYGVSAAAITKANPDANPTKLKIGQKVTIPAAAPKSATPDTKKTADAKPDEAGTYTVKSGDTLGKVAKANKTTVKAIRDLNKLKTDQIKVGQKLKLPTATDKPAAKAAPAS